MRRPLNNNGAPFVLAGAGSAEVFDTEDFDPDQTYAVTLYVWSPTFAGSASGVAVETNGSAQLLSAFDATLLDERREVVNGPVKVADRVIVRGQQKLFYLLSSYGGTPQWIFGYFERAGEAMIKPEFRPLQPTNDLVEPFNAPFTQIGTSGGGADASAAIQQLDAVSQRSDLLTLWVNAVSLTGEPTNGGEALLRIPGLGTDMQLTFSSPATPQAPFLLFDGIPFRATGPSDADSQIQLLLTADGVEALQAIAYGNFTRQ